MRSPQAPRPRPVRTSAAWWAGRVGGDPGFDYSPVLEQAGRGGDSWDVERLVRFLEDPEEMYPGLWMGGNSLRAEAERVAVVRFLDDQR